MLVKLVPALILVAGAGLAGFTAKKNVSEENNVSRLEQVLNATKNSNLSIAYKFDVTIGNKSAKGSIGLTFAGGQVRLQPPKKEPMAREKERKEKPKPRPGAFMPIRGARGMRIVQSILTADANQIAENYFISVSESDRTMCGRPIFQFDVKPKREGRKTYRFFVDKNTNAILGMTATGNGFSLSLEATSIEPFRQPEILSGHQEKRPKQVRKAVKRMEGPDILPGGFRRVQVQIERPIFFSRRDIIAMYSDGLEMIWLVKYDEGELDKFFDGAPPFINDAYQEFKKNPHKYLPKFLSLASATTAGNQRIICLTMLSKKETEAIAAYFAGERK